MALPINMDATETESIEVALLLEAIYRRYGYDFRDYAQASMHRRVKYLVSKYQCRSISAMTERVLHDEDFFFEMVLGFSITVTEMFRDPGFYRGLREKVLPFLKTFPYIKIWHAGCASGEEVYSLAILLKEEGLYDKATIYATDFNDAALQTASAGVYSMEHGREYTSNYIAAGGKASFSDYFYADYDSIIMNQDLKRNVTFANHNLATDGVFSEIHLVLCRNVVIYFNKTLQERVYRLFHESLVYDGFLCLGTKESIDFSDVRRDFIDIDSPLRIFQLKALPKDIAGGRFKHDMVGVD